MPLIMVKATRILIVEDDEDTRKWMRVALGDGKRKIYEAKNAEEGAQLAAKVHPKAMVNK